MKLFYVEFLFKKADGSNGWRCAVVRAKDEEGAVERVKEKSPSFVAMSAHDFQVREGCDADVPFVAHFGGVIDLPGGY